MEVSIVEINEISFWVGVYKNLLLGYSIFGKGCLFIVCLKLLIFFFFLSVKWIHGINNNLAGLLKQYK